jgi:hypothetical protein
MRGLTPLRALVGLALAAVLTAAGARVAVARTSRDVAPDTLLPLSGQAEHDHGPNFPRALELEFSGGDFAAKHVSHTSAGCGSVRTTTVSAIGMISSTGRSARDACLRIASGLTA